MNTPTPTGPQAQEAGELLWKGQLDPRTALAYARRMRDYLVVFVGYDFKRDDPAAIAEQNLGTALDNLEECAAMLMNLASRQCQSTARAVFPPQEFEDWFLAVETGDGDIPVPQSLADGDAWHEHIGRRQIALGAWLAATEAAATLATPARVVSDSAVDAAVEEIRKAKHTCWDRWTSHDAMRAALSAANLTAVNEASKLQAFKDYVHQRLDEAGIPTHPEGEHSAAGCRIGDRLDIALSTLQSGAEGKDGEALDAARYRYLRSLSSRDHGHHTRRAFHAGQVDWVHNLNPNNVVGVCNMWGQSELSGPDLDTAIDTALQPGQGE